MKVKSLLPMLQWMLVLFFLVYVLYGYRFLGEFLNIGFIN